VAAVQIAYVAASSAARNRHPEAMDVRSLEPAHVVLLQDLATEPDRAPGQMLNELSALTGAQQNAHYGGRSMPR